MIIECWQPQGSVSRLSSVVSSASTGDTLAQEELLWPAIAKIPLLGTCELLAYICTVVPHRCYKQLLLLLLNFYIFDKLLPIAYLLSMGFVTIWASVVIIFHFNFVKVLGMGGSVSLFFVVAVSYTEEFRLDLRNCSSVIYISLGFFMQVFPKRNTITCLGHATGFFNVWQIFSTSGVSLRPGQISCHLGLTDIIIRLIVNHFIIFKKAAK